MAIACSICKNQKESSEFSFRNKNKGILHNTCKECMSKAIKKHYLKNREEYIDRASNWAKENKEKRRRNAHNSYAKKKGYAECECCPEESLNKFIETCPTGCEVDHIKNIRQQGKHCLKNLRYLTTSTHARKSQWERYNT